MTDAFRDRKNRFPGVQKNNCFRDEVNMAVYGYARCSTSEERQDIDRQKRELRAAGVPDDQIYWEYESGAKNDRVELDRMLSAAKEGDTIVTTEVSRLARSTQKLCEILEEVKDRKMCLQIIGSMTLDCRPGKETDPATVAMLQVMGAFAELERAMISARVKSGLQNARAKGHMPGRPATTADSIPASFYKYYSRYKRGDIGKTELAKLYGCSRTTSNKYIKLIESVSDLETALKKG